MMMTLPTLILTCMLLSGGALGQGIEIGAPRNGTSVKRGQKIVVEVDRPDTLTGSTELALVIGFLSCPGPESSNCPSPLEEIGTILYAGSYDPEFHFTNGEGFKPPYQNFSVVIPKDAESGVAQLSATHFSLVGAGPFPFLQSRNVTLLVE